MQLEQLKKALNDIVEGKHFEREMWLHLQNQLAPVIMYWQKDQLFKKSIGADGVKFGKYRNESRSKGRDLTRGEKRKARNQEYTLIDTGDFYDKLQIKVDRKRKVIEITSTTDHMDEMYENPWFNTHEFFGLTPFSLRQVTAPLKKHMQKWVRYRIVFNRPL